MTENWKTRPFFPSTLDIQRNAKNVLYTCHSSLADDPLLRSTYEDVESGQ